MIALVSIIIILASILLVAVVFVQNPKGGGLSSDFGAQQIGGVQRTNDFVEKATWTLAAVIMVASIALSSMMAPTQITVDPNAKDPANTSAPATGNPNGTTVPAAPGQR